MKKKFICEECGGSQIGYQEYVSSVSPVDYVGQEVYYGEPQIDESDSVCADFGFLCLDCGHRLFHAGQRIETEQDLQYYLNADRQVLAQENGAYVNHLEEHIEMLEKCRKNEK
ncbi:hypothetical protein STSP2_01398 [Anaerohalosphaera lusitana]|uniref:Uncharacterized protein n=1 Tax=Anaerohalosphaera lusitana TaxID=1936003 RepID=A0A1U9NJZ2_9BACT|nr:hypothetical protein [Anaerohalosphaera lusitana]AQT68242.1 hypothetical protein STSP2_01398 [Anaerohalosphaera lusitana]